MSQLSFLDEPTINSHIARASDPATSQESARETRTKLNVLQQRFVEAIAANGPMTACEAARYCEFEFGGMAESYRKRAGECVRRGVLIGDATRRCSVSGKPATVYRLPQGGSNGNA